MDGIMNPFQREIYETYLRFVDKAIKIFPTYRRFQLALQKDPDFPILISLLYDAMGQLPGQKEQAIALCAEIAKYKERDTDRSEQLMFEQILLKQCEVDYKDAVTRFDGHTSIELDSITQEICDRFFINEVIEVFQTEKWALQLSEIDVDLDVLIALIMGTEKYLSQNKEVLCLVEEIAEYANKHIMKSDRELFVHLYLSEISIGREELLKKFGIRRIVEPSIDFVASSPPVFEKNPPPYQHIVVETSKKQTKNKRRIAELNQLTELLNKGKSFLISRGPVNKDAGIKRIVVKTCFADVVEYLEKNLPEKATILIEQGSAKILFGKETLRTEKSKYQRTSR
jgi:hypothetical protein